jgi:hypothetical protein
MLTKIVYIKVKKVSASAIEIENIATKLITA